MKTVQDILEDLEHGFNLRAALDAPNTLAVPLHMQDVPATIRNAVLLEIEARGWRVIREGQNYTVLR